MIRITRRLARSIRSVFRQALKLSVRGPSPPLMLQGSSSGLLVRCRTPEAVAPLTLAGTQPAEKVWLPFGILGEIEAQRDDPVEIEAADHRVVITWHDGDIPQVFENPAAVARYLPQDA
ncbi:MAG: hypothetical protein ACOY3P_14415 [Planctomycetota bacterium]